MAHIGVFVPGALGHLNPTSCLGRELQARGHRVIVFQTLDLEDIVRRTGLEYRSIGQEQFPPGSYNDHLAHLGTLRGLAALRYTISFFALKSRVLFAEGPDLIQELGVDFLLVMVHGPRPQRWMKRASKASILPGCVHASQWNQPLAMNIFRKQTK